MRVERRGWRTLGAVVVGGLLFGGSWVAIRVQPRWLAHAVAGRTGPVLLAYDPRSAGGQVALTFDDGPDPRGTWLLLDVLAAHGVRATFFLIGERARGCPEAVRAIAGAGHEIGNHVWRDRASVLSGPRAFERELAATQAVLTKLGGAPPRLVRPASGWFTPGMLRAVHRLGCRLALGSVVPPDLELRDPSAAVAFVARRLEAGAVVVLHENHAEPERLAALTGQVLEVVRAVGLTAVPLSSMEPSRTDSGRGGRRAAP